MPNVVTLRLDPERCDGCRMCVAVCPHGVFEMDGPRARIVDRDACMECGACEMNCAGGALAVTSGVGCAAAVINGWIRGGAPNCDCGAGADEGPPSCCGGTP